MSFQAFISDIFSKGNQIPWADVSEESTKAIAETLQLAKVLRERSTNKDLAPYLREISSLLDVLKSPIIEVVGSALPLVSTAISILSAIAQFGKKEPSFEYSVFLLSQGAYLESLQRFFKANEEYKSRIQHIQASKATASQLLKLDAIWEDIVTKESRPSDKIFLCFHESPIARHFNHILSNRLEESGLDSTEAKRVTERISRSTHRYLKQAAFQMRGKFPYLSYITANNWQQDNEIYSSLDKYLINTIRAKAEETLIDEQFSIEEIYVPLSCRPVLGNGNVDESVDSKDLEKWAINLLEDRNKQDRVLFIQAGPGAGKSVFCRIFAEKIRRNYHPIWTPILIPLREISFIGNDFHATMKAYLRQDFVMSDEGWLTDINTRYLFLLDGFDELWMTRGQKNHLKQLLNQVARFQSENNGTKSDYHHRVLVTGRPLALYGTEKDMPHNLEWVDICPLSSQAQELWLKKWNALTTGGIKNSPANLKAFLHAKNCPDQVKELARGPLLLYLIAVMHRDGHLESEMFSGTSRTSAEILLYDRVIYWVLNKLRQQNGESLLSKIAGIDAEELETVFLEAGLCVTQSGREYALASTIENRIRHIDESLAQRLCESRDSSEEMSLKNALAAFHFKASTHSDNSAVEFFHKSFREFFCAKRMAESLNHWTLKSNANRRLYEVNDNELYKTVFDLFGYGSLTRHIVFYIMALLVEEKTNWITLFNRLNDFFIRWCSGSFIEETKNNYLLDKVVELRCVNVDIGTQQVNAFAGLNVLILLLEIHRHGQSDNRLRDKIHFNPSGELEIEDNQRLLRSINIGECVAVGTFRESAGPFLWATDLSHSNLHRVDLHGLDLSSTNLSNTELSGADLSRVNLKEADLHHSALLGAYLLFARLEQANLSEAQLYRADLRKTELVGTILKGADLRSADLKHANLCNADLRGANLKGADLRAADLQNANLTNVQVNKDTNVNFVKNAGKAKLDGELLDMINSADVVPSGGYSEDQEVSEDQDFGVALDRAEFFASTGSINDALSIFNEYSEQGFKIPAEKWYRLCWYGCLYEYAEKVLFAGEEAVKLNPDSGEFRDALALANALTGNFEEAVEGFEFAINSEFFTGRESSKRNRERWISDLKKNINPFTIEELTSLRNAEGSET